MIQVCLKCLYFNIYDTDTTFHVQITFVVQNTYMWNVLYDKTKWKKNCKREKNVKQRLTFALLSDFLQLKGFFLWFLDCSWRVYVTYFILQTQHIAKKWKLKEGSERTCQWEGKWRSRSKFCYGDGHTKHFSQVCKLIELLTLASEYAGNCRRGKNTKRGCLRTYELHSNCCLLYTLITPTARLL